MGYKITQKQDVWKKVGEEDVFVQEYDYGLIMPEFCFLYKKDSKFNAKCILDFIKIAEKEQKIKKEKRK